MLAVPYFLRRSLLSLGGAALLVASYVAGGPSALAADNDAVGCLALTIYHEARGEPLLGQLAVGAVVMNRTRSGMFPAGVCAVVEQGGERLHECQFSWWCDGRSDEPHDAEALRQSYTLARSIYDGCADDPTRGALWFHTVGSKPSWSKAFGPGKRIGGHVFYRGTPQAIASAGKVITAATAAPARAEKSCVVQETELPSEKRPAEKTPSAPGV